MFYLGKQLQWVGLALWFVCVGSGMWYLTAYASRPGVQASPLGAWPSAVPLTPGKDQATLVLLAHPQCNCTNATLSELERIVARRQARLKIHVLFYHPAELAADWAKTSLWDKAAALPGAEVRADPEAQLAQRFGAHTSGQVLLYSPEGQLLFHGGITAARGHEGGNQGSEVIATYLDTGRVLVSQTPVFGCALLSEPPDQSE